MLASEHSQSYRGDGMGGGGATVDGNGEGEGHGVSHTEQYWAKVTTWHGKKSS